MTRPCLVPTFLLVFACAADTSDNADNADVADNALATERGRRICELNELFVEDGTIKLRVWNNLTLHDCPDEWLAAIDPLQYGVGGPRWRTVDRVTALDGTPTLNAPEEVPAGLGYEMSEAAIVDLFPVSVLEMQFGVTIESFDDVPINARNQIIQQTLVGTNYEPAVVQRAFQTQFEHLAGQRVFVLDDGECQYAMKYFTKIVDPELVDEDAVATLGNRFTLLPEGMSFSVRTFEEDLVIIENEGTQFVITDEFGNSYDRFACD